VKQKPQPQQQDREKIKVFLNAIIGRIKKNVIQRLQEDTSALRGLK